MCSKGRQEVSWNLEDWGDHKSLFSNFWASIFFSVLEFKLRACTY
jgi:hypothetical protein